MENKNILSIFKDFAENYSAALDKLKASEDVAQSISNINEVEDSVFNQIKSNIMGLEKNERRKVYAILINKLAKREDCPMSFFDKIIELDSVFADELCLSALKTVENIKNKYDIYMCYHALCTKGHQHEKTAILNGIMKYINTAPETYAKDIGKFFVARFERDPVYSDRHIELSGINKEITDKFISLCYDNAFSSSSEYSL